MRVWTNMPRLGGLKVVVALAALAVAAEVVPAAWSSAAAPPANTAAPIITGFAQAGETLLAQPGSWTGYPITFSYRWLRCKRAGAACKAIPGATQQTYTETKADVGSRIGLTVTATNRQARKAVDAKPTDAVVGLSKVSPIMRAAPTISGKATVGSTLTAKNGSWTSKAPITFKLQWLRCYSGNGGCADAPNATSSTYHLAKADVGFTFRVRLIAINKKGSTTAYSAPTALVPKR